MPPPDTKVQSETLEQIADRLVDEHDCHCCVTAEVLTASYAKLRAAVLSALCSERERAARSAEKTVLHLADVGLSELNWQELFDIPVAIREGR